MNYKRGYAAENKCVNEFRKEGYYATRTAGSHTVFDVIAFVGQEVYAIQVKRTKDGYYGVRSARNKVKAIKHKLPYNVKTWIYVYQDYKGWVLKEKI